MNINFKNIAPNSSSDKNDVVELITILEQTISLFYNSAIFKRDIFEGSTEDHYTETLIKFLEEEKTKRFSFKPQVLQKERRTCDIGVHLKADSEFYIFCIEAKFLPHSPNDYVVGEYAAIKRFKKSEHGLSSFNPNKSYPLSENAIVAYVKSGNFEDHFEKINNEIQELSNQFSSTKDKFGLIWHESEKLTPKYPSQNDKYESKHKRINYPNSTVQLHHFWVKVTK